MDLKIRQLLGRHRERRREQLPHHSLLKQVTKRSISTICRGVLVGNPSGAKLAVRDLALTIVLATAVRWHLRSGRFAAAPERDALYTQHCTESVTASKIPIRGQAHRGHRQALLANLHSERMMRICKICSYPTFACLTARSFPRRNIDLQRSYL